MPPLTRGGKRVAADQPGQLLIYYPDGNYKTPDNNPLGNSRAGAGVAKCGVGVDSNGITKMRHLYNICLPVVTDISLQRFQHLNLGANEHSNIVGEWSALGDSITDIIWAAKNQPDEIMDIEIRQDCFEVLDVLVSDRAYSANIILINKFRKLWKIAK